MKFDFSFSVWQTNVAATPLIRCQTSFGLVAKVIRCQSEKFRKMQNNKLNIFMMKLQSCFIDDKSSYWIVWTMLFLFIDHSIITIIKQNLKTKEYIDGPCNSVSKLIHIYRATEFKDLDINS